MVFTSNKYTRVYYRIVANAKSKTHLPNTYLERHHVIPESLGGENSPENLVKLTAREHFICHWLLTKMTIGQEKSKMVYALSMMRCINRKQQRYQTKITARVYANLKGGRIVSKETREKMKLANRKKNLGRVQPPEERKRRGLSRLGKTHSEETKKKMSQAQSGRTVSEETKDKLREARKLQTTSDETKAKMAESQRKRWEQRRMS